MQLAIFGISNDGLNLAVNLIVLFLVVVWLALIYWTYADARRRMEDPILVACATGASLFPFLGTIIYAILRPPEFLEDAHERELEIRATELRVRQLSEQACPHCEHPIERTYLRCPSCRRRVKDPCAGCGKPLDPRWGVCPYCEAEVVRRRPAAQKKRSQGRPPEDRPPQRKQRAPQRQQRQPQQRQAQPRTQRQAPPPEQRPRPQGAQPGQRGGGSSRPATTS